MTRRVQNNPLGLQLTDIALIAGGIWLIFSPAGKEIRRLLFPETTTPGFGAGAGDASGRNPDNPDEVVVPTTPQFRLRMVSIGQGLPFFGSLCWPFGWRPPYTVAWTIDHAGPAGHFVAAVDLTKAVIGCPVGTHGDTVQTISADLIVRNDPVFTPYLVSASADALMCGAWDARAFVRDLNGRQYVERWDCAAIP